MARRRRRGEQPAGTGQRAAQGRRRRSDRDDSWQGYRFTAATADVPIQRPPQPHPGLGGLPRPVTRFVGREAELAEYARLITQTRLLTLTALGGSGKTRLAIELARRVAHEFPGGGWFVDLAPVNAPERVALAVMSVLGVREDAERSATDSIVGRVDGRPLLLVLDNCEHVLDAVRALIEAMLSRAASVSVLATSRERLGIAGEQVVAVPPLCVATPGAEHGWCSDAAQLFQDPRTSLRRPDLALSFPMRSTTRSTRVCARL
jgi:predicted ATPase